MARFKATIAEGGQKADATIAAYTTGNATADLEINIDSAVLDTPGKLVLAVFQAMKAILDSEAGYPPA